MARANMNTTKRLSVLRPSAIPHVLEKGEVGSVLELLVRDGKGKLTDRKVMRSRSFVRQFLELLWVQSLQVQEVTSYNMRDTGNTLRSICESALSFACDGGLGVTTHGVVVGTGNAAPTVDDYALQTPVAHGTGVGQLSYSAVTFGAPASDATTSQFTVTRNFANSSGGDITVNEIGLYVKAFKYNTTYYFMTIRDAIGGGILVPNGQTLTVNYRLQAVA